MPAFLFRRELIFEVNAGSTGFDHRLHEFKGVKGSTETRFGVGAHFRERRQHEVMEADWSVSPVTKNHKDKAWSQLGTSGSGNHFVEFGIFTAQEPIQGLPPGEYVALLSHSGSRGSGAGSAG